MQTVKAVKESQQKFVFEYKEDKEEGIEVEQQPGRNNRTPLSIPSPMPARTATSITNQPTAIKPDDNIDFTYPYSRKQNSAPPTFVMEEEKQCLEYQLPQTDSTYSNTNSYDLGPIESIKQMPPILANLPTQLIPDEILLAEELPTPEYENACDEPATNETLSLLSRHLERLLTDHHAQPEWPEHPELVGNWQQALQARVTASKRNEDLCVPNLEIITNAPIAYDANETEESDDLSQVDSFLKSLSSSPRDPMKQSLVACGQTTAANKDLDCQPYPKQIPFTGVPSIRKVEPRQANKVPRSHLSNQPVAEEVQSTLRDIFSGVH